jgi:hypothetical protein
VTYKGQTRLFVREGSPTEKGQQIPGPNSRKGSNIWSQSGLDTTFVDRMCHVVSVTEPYGRILGFLDRSRYFLSSKLLLNCTHEAEWIPFQNHYLSQNLEPGPLDL